MKYVRALLAEALRKDPTLLLQERRFWKRDVFALLLERSDDLLLDDPKEARALAKLAPHLARRIADLDPVVNLDQMLFTAYCVLGSSQRASGDLAAAMASYKRAAARQVPRLEVADLLRRKAYLFRDLRDHEQAIACVDEAILIHRMESDFVDRHHFGCCQLARGQIELELPNPSAAISFISTALNHLDVQRDPKTYYAALHNLTLALVDGGSTAELAASLHKLESAHRLLSMLKKRELAKYKLCGLKGLIHVRLGARRKGELLLRKARQHLVALEVPYEVGVISLDLACMYLEEGRDREIETLARDTYRCFRALSVEREALAALSLWTTAIKKRQLSEELLGNVREKLTAFAAP